MRRCVDSATLNDFASTQTLRSDRRIVFINRFFYPDISATSQLLSELAFALAARGLNVHVITSRKSYHDRRISLPAEETVQGVKVHRIATSDFGRNNTLGRSIDYLTFFLFASWAMVRWVRPNDTLIAKTDPPLMSVVALAATKLRGARQINWLQDLFPEVAAAAGFKTIKGPFKWLLQYIRDLSLRHAEANIVIGDQMKARLLERGIPAKKLQVIHNWAIGTSEPVAHKDNPLRSAWGLDGSFVVGYSGNLGLVHDDAIILAAAELLRDRSDIKILFIGGGKLAQPLEIRAKQHRLSNFVFRPYQPAEQLRYSLSAIDMHIISLKHQYEGLIVPSKFYGIAAVARPTIFIGSPNGEIAMLLAQCGGASAIVNTAESLAKCVSAAADNPENSKKLGEAMRLKFGHRSRFDAVVDTWLSMLAPSLDRATNRTIA